jgi:hypothetical protein
MFDGCDSGIVQRGERMFPFCSFDAVIDWNAVSEMLDVIPPECDRFLSTDEILRFYE